MQSENIKEYEVNYLAGGKNSGGYAYRAIIKLRRNDGTLIGAAYFHRSENTMPDHDAINSHDHLECHYRDVDYGHILDILRNEKPVFIEFLKGFGIGNIATSSEPIGEGE